MVPRSRRLDHRRPPPLPRGTLVLETEHNLALQGRQRKARGLFERLLGLRNDVGIVNTARNLTRSGGPAEHRPHAAEHPVAPHPA